ncbi:MAG: Uncharacterised protein [Flavobacterium sp. SCGC AAA160-P02]|nr:MAG: Uncharacterised protein [Flavobacterium sp. SCGC AAA160-P02]
MRLIKSFINGFISRSGNAVFISTVLSRALSFFGSWIALELVDNKELGVILFAFSIIQFIIPIGGFGLHQSLVRYGALLKSNDDKEKLFSYVLIKGGLASVLLIILVVFIGQYIPFQFENTYYYLSLLSSAILSHFIFELVKTQFRLQHKNILFAKVEFWQNFLLVLLIFVLSTYFSGLGYIIAIISSPIITSLFYIKKLRIKFHSNSKLSIVNIDFWKYGFFGGLSNVASQFLFVIDIILIGYLMNNPIIITNYRYISIIPFSLLFLPRIFIATDFVSFTEKINQKEYIKNYIKSYMLFFGILSLFIVSICYVFGNSILGFVFGDEYARYSDSFFILIVGIVGVFIFRGIFGNLLSSIGKIKVNYYITCIAIIINIISNYFLIPIYGIKGAAITSSLLMWFTGLLSWGCFSYLYKELK